MTANLTDRQKRVNRFIDYVEAAGADTVAAVLGFQGNLDEPEDLAEDVTYAFEGLGDEDQEQALRVLAMSEGTRSTPPHMDASEGFGYWPGEDARPRRGDL